MQNMPAELTRGSSHNSLLLFLLQQASLIENFNYFQSDSAFYDTVSTPESIRSLIGEVLHDSTSQTNQALMVTNYYLCQKLKKLLLENQIDINRLWKSGLDPEDTIEILTGQIPFIDQCELWRCTERLQEIAH
jgi:hypothetical protein